MKPKQGGSYQSSSTTASYSYGANGLRKSKSVGGKTTGFVWDRGNLAAEMTGSTITNMYNYGPDGITEREKSNGEISIYLKSAHGDVIGVSDEYGIPEERYQFDAFGNIQTETEPAPFGYCGEYRDAESGLIYLRNRYYDPETGRFITEDPVKDGTNWYVYAANNPIMFVDPWGLELFLKGTTEEIKALETSLVILTDNYIDVNDSGEVTMKDGYENSRFQKATNMVSSIIDSPEVVIVELGNENITYGKWSDEYDDGNIHITVTGETTKALAWSYETNSVEIMDTPEFLVLGHELIHANRLIKGTAKKDVAYHGYYYYYDENGNQQLAQFVNQEELETTGIDYMPGSVIRNPEECIPLNGLVPANSYPLSENALRREHYLGDRIAF